LIARGGQAGGLAVGVGGGQAGEFWGGGKGKALGVEEGEQSPEMIVIGRALGKREAVDSTDRADGAGWRGARTSEGATRSRPQANGMVGKARAKQESRLTDARRGQRRVFTDKDPERSAECHALFIPPAVTDQLQPFDRAGFALLKTEPC
jgi:hypothetical protein